MSRMTAIILLTLITIGCASAPKIGGVVVRYENVEVELHLQNGN